MSELKEFLISLPALGEGHHELELKVDTGFFTSRGNTEVSEADVAVYVDIDVRHEVYMIGITCQGNIFIPCDRCLEPMPIDIDEDYDVTVRYGEEYEETDDTIIIPEDEVEFDLSSIVADTILLSIPLRHVHPEGECNAEMVKIMQNHSAEELDSEEDI